jgi:hypothetical protein
MMDIHRKEWNHQQQMLRQLLTKVESHQESIEAFLNQHAMVHSAEMSHAGLWSFEDETLAGLTDEQMRQIPPNFEHSIAWLIWHLTRIEDVTMNLLAAGSMQVMLKEGWLEKMKISDRDTGNGMVVEQVERISKNIDLETLRAYRLCVGRRTREIVKHLQPEQMKKKVDATRLQQITSEGAVLDAGRGVLDYWGGLTITGLLLMPPTRHNFIHWNEARLIRQKLTK